MDNQEDLQEYSDSIKRLRKQCLDTGMSDDEFRKMYFESLNSIHTNETVESRNCRTMKTKRRLLFIAAVILIGVVLNFKTVYSCLVCNLQDYVYPGLRLLRRISIPFLSLFPSLTNLYHESCLVQNPFFTVVDMDCWPCSTITNVPEVHDPKPIHQQHTSPFIYETSQKVVNLETLKDLYQRNQDIFNTESPKIFINNKFYADPEELFSREHMKEDRFYIWRFNNMNVARILRQIIQRPKVVPMFGQSIERFLIVDSSQESLHIPDTECNFSFLLSLSGTRTVNLIPAEECKFQCRILKVELKETYLLWYNWWYWRPVIEQSTGNSTFIGHVGSYC